MAAHWISLILNLLIMGRFCIYIFKQSKNRQKIIIPSQSINENTNRQKFIHQYGPSILVFIGFPLILLDPLRHVLSDNNIWQSCQRRCGDIWPQWCMFSPNMYQCKVGCYPFLDDGITLDRECTSITADILFDTCDSGCMNNDDEYNIHNYTMIEWIILFCTYFGFLCFLTGSMWNVNIIMKCTIIYQHWKTLRNQKSDTKDKHVQMNIIKKEKENENENQSESDDDEEQVQVALLKEIKNSTNYDSGESDSVVKRTVAL